MSGVLAERSGLFIVFEGVEGAGKSTHIKAVSDRLTAGSVDHLLIREPGGTVVGERARELVLDPGLEMCAESELFLYLTSRAEFVRSLVIPALQQDRLVLADRYELSTFAYQGAARGLDLERVREANHVATGGLKPDLTVLLRIDPQRGRGRQLGEPDRLERERAEFHRMVAVAYEEMARLDPDVVSIETEGDMVAVQERIWGELSARWPDRFAADSVVVGNISTANEFQNNNPASSGDASISTVQEEE